MRGIQILRDVCDDGAHIITHTGHPVRIARAPWTIHARLHLLLALTLTATLTTSGGAKGSDADVVQIDTAVECAEPASKNFVHFP